MFFNLCKGFAWYLATLLSALMINVSAQQTSFPSPSLNATPNNCVTLHQGRTCYTKVSLIWQASVSGNYCLQKKSNEKTMQCWRNRKSGQWIFEFQGDEKVDYQLISLANNQVLAEASVTVSWVHKATPRKRRWRLF